jgi:hypothetical protein
MRNRPLSVTIIACVYIVSGAIGFAYHFNDFLRQPFEQNILLVELIRLLAIVCGIFLLRGYNWARWLAVAWIAYHVMLSAFHAFSEFAIHCLLLAVIAWSLFRPAAATYFRPRSAGKHDYGNPAAV